MIGKPAGEQFPSQLTGFVTTKGLRLELGQKMFDARIRGILEFTRDIGFLTIN